MEDFSDVKMQEVENMVRQYTEERSAHEALEQEFKNAKKITDNTGSRILAVLEQFKLGSHKTVYGTVIRNQRWSWKTPKEDHEREAFKKFLVDTDQFDTLWSVNSQTLNSRAKEWLEEAAEKGDIDWCVPGLTEPTCKEYLSLRKK